MNPWPVQHGGEPDCKTAANREHLAAGLIASAEAKSAAAVTPPVLGSGYAVQVASERIESGAQAARSFSAAANGAGRLLAQSWLI